MRNQAEEAPSEVEIMKRHVKLILDDKEYRDYIEAEVEEYKRRLGEAVVFVLSPNSLFWSFSCRYSGFPPFPV